ncbi:MAG TPA: LEA type 2 family protein [Steroidobacteraceae bacterium]|jgi:LEA14-like dessication related protein
MSALPWVAPVVTCLLISGCAAFAPHDPLQVTVAGIEPLQGQGLEMRMNIKLRVQNPNDAPVDYNGIALQMDVQGKTFASGVTDATGTVPRFGESVITVPMTISALRMMRQAMGMMTGAGINKIEYQMKGKLSGSLSATRFTSKGQFDLPPSPTQTTD